MALNVIEMSQLIKLYQERTGITDDMIAGTGGGIGGAGGSEVRNNLSLVFSFPLCMYTMYGVHKQVSNPLV